MLQSLKIGYNLGMVNNKGFKMNLDQFTVKQCKDFQEFCKRHNIKFNNIPEYYSALVQYYKKG